MGNMKTIFIFKWNCKNGFVFVEMHPNLNVQRAGNRVTFAIWNIPHTTIFHFLNFIGVVREYFANGFVLSLYQSCAHTKKLFPFFFFSSWQRKGSFVTVVVMRRILSNYWQGIIITFSRFLRNTIRNCCYAQKLLEIKDIVCMITLLR